MSVSEGDVVVLCGSDDEDDDGDEDVPTIIDEWLLNFEQRSSTFAKSPSCVAQTEMIDTPTSLALSSALSTLVDLWM